MKHLLFYIDNEWFKSHDFIVLLVAKKLYNINKFGIVIGAGHV